MSVFGIFALSLTTLYIIYYGVAITKDIIKAKKRDSEESEAMELDTSFMEKETVHVEESYWRLPQSAEQSQAEDIDSMEKLEADLENVEVEMSEGVTADVYMNDLMEGGECKPARFVKEFVHAAQPETVTGRDEM